MAKLTLTDIDAGYGSTTAINANNALIEAALENTLSLDGTTPNSMQSDFDMNGYSILNLLSSTGEANFSNKGEWAASTAYLANNLVYVTTTESTTNGGATYICTTSHTSGLTFDPDLTSYWQLFAKRGATGAGSGDMLASNNLSDVNSVITSRANLSVAGIYDSVAALRAVSTGAGTVLIKGHTSDGDGGEGAFYWDSTSTEADDGGTIIKATSITTGRWKRFYSGKFNVEDYGAVGDGVTDDTTDVQAALTAGVGKLVVVDQLDYLTSALTSDGNIIDWPSGSYNSSITLTDPIDQADLSEAPQLIYGAIGGKHGYTFRNSNITANDIYEPVYPNIKHYDGVNAVTHVVSGSTIEHATAVAGYVKTDTAGPTNAVALFGNGIATVQDASLWGINTLLQDQATRVTGTLTGITLSNEFDFNIMNPGTEVVGMSLGGNSLAQPTTANGFIANVLGTGIKWTTGFYAIDGACTNGFVAGLASASGANVSSCNVLLQSTDGSSVKQTATINAQAGAYVVLSGMSFKVSANNILLDTGQGIIVNGNTVLTDRLTGWGAPTGTATRTTFVTSTVTTAQLAERVKALIDDLTTHGMIGV